MSCGQIALDELNIDVKNYYASEINKYAIKVTQHNYPNTKQIGDIKKLTKEKLDKLPKIDLIIGGSPCQNLSPAVISRNNYNQGLKGEKSSLFYEFVRIFDLVKKKNPDFKFLFENVAGMSNKDEQIISKTLEVEPLMIDSNLFSAQNRKRYYWTNLEVDDFPKKSDKVLEDIILSPEEVEKEDTGRMKVWYEKDFERINQSGNVAALLDINGHDILKRVYKKNHKCATLTTCGGGNTQKKIIQEGRVRKLLPIEYERLQNVPDNYTDKVSNTRRYNMLGNGWTVGVIKHIVKRISKKKIVAEKKTLNISKI
jgi:DNA (cytosine-5)-methyltransferase 3A